MQKDDKARLDWVGKVIHRELLKKLKFDHTNKAYNPESVLENETHKLHWDFEIQTVHLTLARRPELEIVNKENLPNCELSRPGKTQSKIKIKQKER